MKKKVLVLAEAASDIERGIDFYNAIEDGVGLYFRDSIIAEIRRLSVYFGEHRIHSGYFRALSSRFPYAIYYRDMEGSRQEHVTKTELASRMKTSRASLDRMLDPSNPSLTVASLGKAAAALGRKVELRFVPA
jgi:hypothetical protein